MISGRVPLSTVACTAPLLCAVHCVSAPLLVAFAPALGPTPATEWLLVASAVLISGPVIALGFRVHRRVGVLVAASAGVLIWVLSLAGAFMPVAEEVTTTMGSILLAGSLVFDRRWRGAAETGVGCGCIACDAPGRSGSAGRQTSIS